MHRKKVKKYISGIAKARKHREHNICIPIKRHQKQLSLERTLGRSGAKLS